jgi:hypothetical protein
MENFHSNLPEHLFVWHLPVVMLVQKPARHLRLWVKLAVHSVLPGLTQEIGHNIATTT